MVLEKNQLLNHNRTLQNYPRTISCALSIKFVKISTNCFVLSVICIAFAARIYSFAMPYIVQDLQNFRHQRLRRLACVSIEVF